MTEKKYAACCAIVLLSFSGSCKSAKPEITRAFTSKMSATEQLRTQVELRVRNLKDDCAQRLLLQILCDMGRRYYTDSVQARFNGWIAAVQSDLTRTDSLDDLQIHDDDFNIAAKNAAGFTAWADYIHSIRVPPS